jgi:hypothetical protein
MVRSLARVGAMFAFWGVLTATVAAQTPPAGGPSGSSPPLPAYSSWTKDAEKQDGLFTVWRKDGKVYLELRTEQLDKDFLQTAVPANGLGGYGIQSGQMFQQEARLVRFIREGRTVAIVWPQTRFTALPNTPLADAIRLSTADSVMGMAPVLTENGKDSVVIDMSALLGDVMNLTEALRENVADPKDPTTQYHLDPSRTYFGASKAFPKNVVIEADETFASMKPPEKMNTVTDPRSLQMRVTYNFLALPENDGYMPRLADDRIGYFEDAHISFNQLSAPDDFVHYLIRWNIQPSDPTQRISPAKAPIVFTLSNTIPLEYRDPIRRAVLAWNAAFERLGVSNAVQVQDQPADPAWDPDDARNNVIRWLTEANSGGFAEAQLTWDPRTGEVFRGGVLIDSDLVHFGNRILEVFSSQSGEPAGDAQSHRFMMHNDGASMADQFAFGAYALAALTGEDPQTVARKNASDFLYSIVLHEVGHDWGLMHNFIGHVAYRRSDLRSKKFTQAYGLSTSVMDYIPFNLAPRGASNGDLFQPVLGPYDYHAIAYGYTRIPGATTPDAELPALHRIASEWSNPRFRFASDEDVEWANGHAVDPRVEQFLLSDDQIGWCDEQLQIVHAVLKHLDSSYPRPEHSWDDERAAFGTVLNQYGRCTIDATHYIGGEYLSRARVGDTHAALPLTVVSRADELRAFQVVDRNLFSDRAWHFSPTTLRRLVYSEHEPFLNFGYTEQPRFDVSVAAVAARFQDMALSFMFSPVMLQRIVDLPSKAAGMNTMTMTDLFTWNQNAIFGDVRDGSVAHASSVRRNLQRRYTALLAKLAAVPTKGTPYDAQALARYELGDLQARIGVALHKTSDLQTRAHLEAMRSDATRALRAREVYQQAG